MLSGELFALLGAIGIAVGGHQRLGFGVRAYAAMDPIIQNTIKIETRGYNMCAKSGAVQQKWARLGAGGARTGSYWPPTEISWAPTGLMDGP